MTMINKLNRDSINSINSRMEGEGVLSWIENFGLYLVEQSCVPHLEFRGDEGENVLVLRFRNRKIEGKEKEKVRCTMSAYLCYFKSVNGFTRFCINSASDEYSDRIIDLMDDKVQWKSEATRNYWREVFRDGKQPIDEDTLKRKEVLASGNSPMNMMDFLKAIEEEIRKAISILAMDIEKVNKVIIVEQYALALPFQYVLKKMFPGAEGHIYGIVWKEKKKSWQEYASRFHAPGKLLYSNLLTSPKIKIGDIIALGEKGIMFTLPLSKSGENEYSVPECVFFENSYLKWSELSIKERHPDYLSGNIAFKRVQISFCADGFQNVYLICDNEIKALLSTGSDKLLVRLKRCQAPIFDDINGNGEEKESRTRREMDKIKEISEGEKKNTDETPCRETVYVIDTNVFLDCPSILDLIPTECKIGLTAKIIDEIDDNKNKNEDLKRRAVQAQKSILKENQKGGRIIFQEPNLKLLNGLNGAKPDNKILALALTLKKVGYKTIVLTSDNGLLLSASLNSIGTKRLNEIKDQKR